MQSLKATMLKDQQIGQSSNVKESTSVLDCLGYDINSMDHQLISTTVSYDNNVLSNASLTGIQAGTTITLNIQEQQVHFLDRYYICGQVNCYHGYLPNYLSLFRGSQYTIGKITKSTGTNEYLSQMMLDLSKKKKVRNEAKGLGLALDPFDSIQPNAAVTVASRWLQVDEFLRTNQANQVKGVFDVSDNTYQFAVKLTRIFPELKMVADDCAIPLLGGNTMQFTIVLNQPNLCMVRHSGAAPNYDIDNLHVVRQMTRDLTPQQINNLSAANILLPFLRGYQGVAFPMSSSNNITMSIPMGSRPRAILFSAFPNEGYVSSDTTTGLVDANTENIVTRRGGVYSRLHAPLHFSPVLPINQVLLMIGGYTLTVPLHLVQNFELWSQQMGYDQLYDNALL